MHGLQLCSARALVQLSVAHCSSSRTELRLCGTLRAVKLLIDHQGTPLSQSARELTLPSGDLHSSGAKR